MSLSDLVAAAEPRLDLADTPSGRALYDAVHSFAADVVAPGAAARAGDRRFERDVWRAAARFGLAGEDIAAPGEPVRTLPLLLVLEALQHGGGDSGFSLAVGAHLGLCTLPVARFGTAALRARVLPRLASGEWIGAFAVSEAGHGSDVAATTATATAVPGGYRLDGVKSFVSNGSVADVVLVLARTAPGDLGFGLTVLAVETGATSGMTVRDQPLSGYRGCPVGEIGFASTFVPEDAVLGRKGAGLHQVARFCFELERSVLLGPELGEMRRCLDFCVDTALRRDTSAGPLIRLGQTQRTLATMKARLEAARLAAHRSAWQQDGPERDSWWGPVAKKLVAEAALANAADTVHLCGADAATKGSPIEYTLADAGLAGLAGGTTELQEQAITTALAAMRPTGGAADPQSP